MQAETELNTDQILAQSLQNTKNVVLAMHFTIGNPLGRPDTDLPDYVQRFKLQDINTEAHPLGYLPLPAAESLIPIAEVGPYADGIGALVSVQDVDGAIRSEPLIIDYFGDYYPLTPYSVEEDAWLAWQFHDSRKGQGVLWTRAYGDEYWADVTSPLFFSLLGSYLTDIVNHEGARVMGYRGLTEGDLIRVHKVHVYFSSAVLEEVFTYNPPALPASR